MNWLLSFMSRRSVSFGQGWLQAGAFKDSANTTITVVEKAVGDGGSVDLTELKNAQKLLGDAEEDLESAESSTRDATDAFGGVIIFIGVCAIVCAILGLLCVFVRVCYFPLTTQPLCSWCCVAN